MYKYIITVFVFVFCVQTASFAAWGKSDDEKPSPGAPQQQDARPLMRMSRELNLSSDQLREVDRQSIKFEKETLPFVTRMKEQHLQMKELLLEDAPDQNKIKELIRDLGKTEILLKEKRVDAIFDILKILTPEQQTKMKNLHLFGGLMGGRMAENNGAMGRNQKR